MLQKRKVIEKGKRSKKEKLILIELIDLNNFYLRKYWSIATQDRLGTEEEMHHVWRKLKKSLMPFKSSKSGTVNKKGRLRRSLGR